MKCFKLSPKSHLRLSNSQLLAKAPLIPHQYLFKARGHDLALLQHQEDGSFLLICSADEFWKNYQPYYEARFELETMPEDFEVPEAYEVIYGKVQFEDGTALEKDEQATEPSQESA